MMIPPKRKKHKQKVVQEDEIKDNDTAQTYNIEGTIDTDSNPCTPI